MDMLFKMLASGTQQPELIEPAGLAGLRLPLLPAEISPDRHELVDLAGRAVVALQTQHIEETETAFKRLVTAYPNEPGVHFLYGAFLMKLHPNEAVSEFERELEISPSHVLARVRLGAAIHRAAGFRPGFGACQASHKARAKTRLGTFDGRRSIAGQRPICRRRQRT